MSEGQKPEVAGGRGGGGGGDVVVCVTNGAQRTRCQTRVEGDVGCLVWTQRWGCHGDGARDSGSVCCYPLLRILVHARRALFVAALARPLADAKELSVTWRVQWEVVEVTPAPAAVGAFGADCGVDHASHESHESLHDRSHLDHDHDHDHDHDPDHDHDHEVRPHARCHTAGGNPGSTGHPTPLLVPRQRLGRQGCGASAHPWAGTRAQSGAAARARPGWTQARYEGASCSREVRHDDGGCRALI